MHLLQKEENLIEMQNGCICCTLREDLLIEIANLAFENKYDYLVIESTGIAEPLQTAETFTFSALLPDNDDATGNVNTDNKTPASLPFEKLDDISRLDTLVTMVDAYNFFNDVKSVEMLSQKYGNSANVTNDISLSKGEFKVEQEDERYVSHLLIDQIEFSNVIIINKCDKLLEKFLGNNNIKKSSKLYKLWTKKSMLNVQNLVSQTRKLVDRNKKINKNYVKALDGLISIFELCKKLSPQAKIYFTNHSKINIKYILNTKLFSFENAKKNYGWLKELRNKNEHVPETIEYNISSFIYRARKPFNPEKLHKFLDPINNKLLNTVLRGKGLLWLAHYNDIMINWNQCGKIIDFQIGLKWFVCQFNDQLGSDQLKNAINNGNISVSDLLRIEKKYFVGKYGDRRQEIVFIGQDMNKKAIINQLNKCLLTNDEMKLEDTQWKTLFNVPSNLNFDDIIRNSDHYHPRDDIIEYVSQNENFKKNIVLFCVISVLFFYFFQCSLLNLVLFFFCFVPVFFVLMNNV